MKVFLIFVFVFSFSMTACDSQDKTDTDTQPAPPTGTLAIEGIEPSSPPPTIALEIRSTLESNYDALRTAQVAIYEVWSALQENEAVSCSEELPFLLNPQEVNGEDEISAKLYAAALQLQDAYRLWTAECADPRSQPPADVIGNGLRAALSADTHLNDAETLLTQ